MSSDITYELVISFEKDPLERDVMNWLIGICEESLLCSRRFRFDYDYENEEKTTTRFRCSVSSISIYKYDKSRLDKVKEQLSKAEKSK